MSTPENRTRFSGIEHLRGRLFRSVSCWSLGIEGGGQITWWSADDIHLRQREIKDIDWEVRFPWVLFRPLCWLLDHDEYYGYCVYCHKIRRQGETRGWRVY